MTWLKKAKEEVEGWRKVPAVKEGGKPYFYVRLLDKEYDNVQLKSVGLDTKVRVAWNRIANAWEISTGSNFEKPLGFVDTNVQGQHYVDSLLNNLSPVKEALVYDDPAYQAESHNVGDSGCFDEDGIDSKRKDNSVDVGPVSLTPGTPNTVSPNVFQ